MIQFMRRAQEENISKTFISHWYKYAVAVSNKSYLKKKCHCYERRGRATRGFCLDGVSAPSSVQVSFLLFQPLPLQAEISRCQRKSEGGSHVRMGSTVPQGAQHRGQRGFSNSKALVALRREGEIRSLETITN